MPTLVVTVRDMFLLIILGMVALLFLVMWMNNLLIKFLRWKQSGFCFHKFKRVSEDKSLRVCSKCNERRW